MAFAFINYILIVCAAVASALGFINGVGDDYDVIGFSGVVLPVVALVVILCVAIIAPKKKVGAHFFLWAAALALISRSAFTASPDLQEVYVVLLVISVLLPALVKSNATWLGVFLFVAIFYPAHLVIEQKLWVEPPQDNAFYVSIAEFLAVSFFVGLIPWIVLRKRVQALDGEFNKTLEEVRNNAITDGMARAHASPSDTSKKGVPPGTASLSANTLRIDSPTDTLSLLSNGGEEVNVQLKSMLFFIRYNFKGLTAAAFIYDTSKRVLVLNCYETKGGIQIKENVRIPFGAGVIGQVAADNKMFMSGDVSLYGQGDTEHSYYTRNENIYSILAAPIIDMHSKEFLGVLAVDSPNKNAFTEHDKEQMRRFAMIAAALIVNIRLTISLVQAAKVFRVFYEVSHQFSIALKMEDVFAALMTMVPKIVPYCTRQIITLYDQSKNCLRLNNIVGATGELTEGVEFSPESGGIYSYAFNKKCSVNIPDLQTQRSYRFVPEEPPNPTIRSLLILPIIGGEDHRCLGLFSIESNTPDLFKSELEQHLTTIIENASVTVTRALLYLKMEKLATTDGLTGLNNHRTFQEIAAREFERARRYNSPLSFLLTDIDHFKSFNDTYGHPVGDLVLREIAACIRNTVRINDFPARYGGEEFAVILPETNEQGAYVIAERVRQAVEARVIDSGPNKLHVTISIGCVSFPTYGTTQQELIDCSDKALYTSKKSGRNRVTMYDPSMTVASK